MIHITLPELAPGSTLHLSCSWDEYQRMAQARGDSSIPRMKYRNGEVLIMVPLPEHGKNAHLIARVAELLLEPDRRRYEAFTPVTASPDQVKAFWSRWHIIQFALFGSVLREDFDLENSDIDVLAAFAADTQNGMDEWLQMEQELSDLFGRKVDLVDQEAVNNSRNPFRRHNILSDAQVIYDG